MDRLTSMTIFVRVANALSFSAAARELGISQAAVSKHVQALEEWLGTSLFRRTTRRVAVTDAGEGFFTHCIAVLSGMDEAKAAAQPTATVSGSIRITAPIAMSSTRLAPLIVEFLQENPDLSIGIDLSDRSVDVIEEGYDLAIRSNRVEGPGLTSYRLMPLNHVLCAGPGYLASHGVPARPIDLINHQCIAATDDADMPWRFVGPDGESSVQVRGRLQANNALLRRDAARANFGVLLCADYLVTDDLASGRLQRLLPDYTPMVPHLHAVCPAFQASTAKMRRLISHLTAGLAG